jgi:outer membrane protein
VDAARKKILLAQGDLFPMINLRAQHNRFGGDPLVDGNGLTDIEPSDESTVGIFATWELWGGNSTTNDVSKARAGEREARQTLIQVKDEIVLEVQTNYERAQTSFTNIDTARVAVEQAKENFRMNQLRYREQLATNTDVLDARRLLSETEYQYYASLYEYNILLAGLARSAGLEDIRKIEAVQAQPRKKKSPSK